MEQGRKSLGEIFISGTEREPLPLVAPVSLPLFHFLFLLLVLCAELSSSSVAKSHLHPLLCWQPPPPALNTKVLRQTFSTFGSRGGKGGLVHLNTEVTEI